MGIFGKRDKANNRKQTATDVASVCQPMALALEPRFMFDAAGAATGAEIAEQTAADSLADTVTPDTPATPGDAPTDANVLIVVDTSVAGYSTLIEGLSPGATVLEIGADEDGMHALADALSPGGALGGQSFDAIHVVSHGGEGQVQLGSTLLTSDSLSNYGDALSALGAALTADGDLLLYGCEVGTGTGQAFIDDLATKTGADIAASDDLTGAADMGGDWDLEVVTGSIEADLPFSARAMADFTGVLALPADNTTFNMTPAGGWTDAGNSLTHSYFTATGSDTVVGSAVDPKLSATGAYMSTGGTNAVGTWTVTADGTNVATFQLTTLVARDYYANNNFGDVYIKGYVSGGGTVTSTTKNGTDGVQDVFTFSGGDMTNFSGVNLTSFKLFFSEADTGDISTGDFEFQSFTTTAAAAPSTDAAITSATYDSFTGNLVLTGTNFTATGGTTNDVIASKITLTGEGGETYTLTDTANVEISSATGFTLVLSATDKAALNTIMNKDDNASTSATTYDIDGAAGFIAAQAAIADTGVNGVTVSNVPAPTITSAAYNANTGALTVTGTGLTHFSGATNDIDVSKFTFTGEGGATYTLTSATDVEITSGTAFTVTLSAADKAALNQIMNKDGTSSTSATTYNIAAAEDWNRGPAAAVTIADLTGNAVTVSSVPAPAITSATYNASTGALVVTGTGFTKFSGATNDIDVSMFTFTGEGGATYTLTDSSDVEITSGTAFTVTLSTTDKAALNQIMNKDGTASTSATTYNLNAAEDWARGAAATVNVVDATGNGVTVSNVPAPAITSATYNASTGALVVTGTGFTKFDGATNDIDVSMFTFTGEGGATYTLTDSSDVEITSGTAFTVALSATDKAALNQIMNKDLTVSTSGTTYNLNAAEDWARGAAAAVNIVDATGNGVTVSNVPAPAITSATYDYNANVLTVTGTGFVKKSGATNDIDISKFTFTGEGGATYTLTSASDVEITSGTAFSITLSGADLVGVESLLNKDGTTASSGTTYNLSAAEDWAVGADANVNVVDATANAITVSNYAVPTVTSATYDYSTGALVVTGTNFVSKSGANNDIDISKLVFTGEGGVQYQLTSASDVEVTSATSYTVTLTGADLTNVEGLLNKTGTTSATSGTTFSLVSTEDWMAGSPAANNVADAAATITVSNYAAPAITSATYDYNTNVLTVTGTNFVTKQGATNDIDLSTLTFTGEGGTTYTLTTTTDIDITSATQFTVTLSGADLVNVESLLNKTGTTSATSGTTYNLAAADNWMFQSPAALNIADATSGVTVSNYAVPTITSSTYDFNTGTLVVTGTNLVGASGVNNDIIANKFTFTGDGGATYTLTDTSNVDVTSATSFTITLSATDKLAIGGLLNKDGTASDTGTTYNINAAEDWAAGAPATNNVVDATGNGVTVSNYATPAITSATYDYNTNALTVTGTNFVNESGATNDVDISMFTFTGEGGATYTLTSASDVEVTSATSFTVTLAGSDLVNVEALLNKDGTTSATAGTTYNLAAADNWMPGAAATADIADATNAITVSNYAAPTVTSATYNVATGALVVTGTNFVNASGAANDITANLFTLTGEGGSYTLTDTANVEVTSATSFTLTLSATDQLNIHGLLNKNGTASSGATTYNLAAADNWMAGTPAALSIADATGNGVTVSNVATPTITSATYDSDTGVVSVTGTNLFKKVGAANDIDISTLTFTGGTGNATYTVTSASDIEITSATAFSFTLSGADKTNVDALLDQIGTSSSGGSTYNIAGADNWLTGADAATNIADATNAVTVSISPKLTSATYNASTGTLVVTGTNIQANGGGADIDASMLTLTGEGGATYTLTDTADVERTSATAFTLTLSATDKAALNQIMNKDGTSSTGTTTYNVAAADNWNTNVTAGDTSDATANAVTVSNVAVPTITSSTYDAATGTLVVTGTGFTKFAGAANDIDVSKFTFTGAGGTYTLTSATDVEITSGTAFTLTLSAADKAGLNLIMNKNGTASNDTVAYNLSAAEDWARGADAAINVIDAAGNGVTVSNVAVPTITSSTYDAATGSLVVTGTGFLSKSGATNDIVANKFTFTGEGGATYTLTDSSNVEVTSGTSFTLTLSATDKAALNLILNKNGTSATSTTTYNLNAAEDWTAGADAAVNVVDATANAVTVSNVAVPSITSSTYDATTGALVVTGTGFTNATGGANDIDVSKFTFTGEGGATYTLTSATDVEITSGASFTITLNATDKAALNLIINKDGTSSTGTTTYNLAAAEDWARGADAAVNIVDATGNGVTVSNVAVPTITSASFGLAGGWLQVTGTGFTKFSGAANDIDASKFTFTAEGETYTLTDSFDVEITSGTSFIINLSAADKAALSLIVNRVGASSTNNVAYNLAAAEDWARGADATVTIADLTSNSIGVASVAQPLITSATYNASTGALVVTGANLAHSAGASNDIDVSMLTLTGEGGATYTLTDSSDVEITSGTEFTITLSATDKAALNQIMNKNGTSATSTTTYNIAAAEDWARGSDKTTTTIADLTSNSVTVSNVAAPAITSSTYDVTTGALVVTGTGFTNATGGANDIDVSKFTFTGEGGATYTLTSATDVEITSGTSFTITLSGADKLAVNGLLNKNGTTSDGATTYNLAAAEDWARGADAAVNVVDGTSAITVSNYAAPTVTSATYDSATNQLVVTGTNFVSKSGAANDIDISTLTFTGEGGGSYTLTSATDVEITSATSFTVTLSGADLLAVEGLLNKNGTTSDGGTTYNLAAADNWMAAGPASVDIADATANAVTLSNNTAPAITSTAYDIGTGILTVTGSNFVSKLGAANDVDVSAFTFTGEGGATYTLTSTTDVEVTSPTSFTITLSGADRLTVAGLLNKDGTQSDGATAYNIAAADNWMTGAAANVNVADATNAVTAGGYVAPTITSATLNATTGEVTVTGTGFVTKLGAANDVDLSTLTFTGQGGATYTLTTATDVDVTSATGFSLTLSGADLTNVLALLNTDGTSASDSTTYNIAGADNWMAAAAASVNIADATNGVTVSNTPPPPPTTNTGLNVTQQPPTPPPPPLPPIGGEGGSGGPENTAPPTVNDIPTVSGVGQTRGPVTNDVLNTGIYINGASISDPGGVDVLSIVGNSVSGQASLIDSFYGAGRTDTTTRGGEGGGAGNTGGAGPTGGLGDGGGFNALAGNSVLNSFGGVGGFGQSFGLGDGNGGGIFGGGQGPELNGQNGLNGQGGLGGQDAPGPGATLRPVGRAGFSDQLAQAAGGVSADMSRLAKAVKQAQEASAA